ncbi:MAG: hypothetical protein GTN71_00430 [Anaerolineae bacterium]|nr:hypothetical protein [Anaerolineae bacterium]
MPSEGVSIRKLRAIPLPDMKRVTVEMELSPFAEHPNLDISILSPEGEVIANMFVVEARDQVMALTLHLRQPEPEALYTARLKVLKGEETLDQREITFAWRKEDQ